MADNKPKTDRRDEKVNDSEFDNYDSDVGGAGGQAGSAGRSDMEDSYNPDDFYADEGTS